MKPGRLIAVVGPSGAGKDSVMTALEQAVPTLASARRVITRPKAMPAEAHDTMTETEFANAVASGAFCLWWCAHGLHYGIPSEMQRDIAAGKDRLANLSRTVLHKATEMFPRVTILFLTARPETLAARLGMRGRETADEIAGRLARPALAFPAGAKLIEVQNDGPLSQAVRQALAALQAGNDLR